MNDLITKANKEAGNENISTNAQFFSSQNLSTEVNNRLHFVKY